MDKGVRKPSGFGLQGWLVIPLNLLGGVTRIEYGIYNIIRILGFEIGTLSSNNTVLKFECLA